MKVWVLTHEINQYDQDGEYHDAVFCSPPVAHDLNKHAINCAAKYL